jgi:hypothetical protein
MKVSEAIGFLCAVVLSIQTSFAEDVAFPTEANDETWDSVMGSNHLILAGFFAPWFVFVIEHSFGCCYF